MPISTPQEMTNAIDAIGTTLSFVCSDPVSLMYIENVFAKSPVGALLGSFQEKRVLSQREWAALLKNFVVGDCLRNIQFALYADDVVEESELDIVYPIIKPLAYFYSQYNKEKYARFNNLQRSGVFDFIHVYMQDKESFFSSGSIRYMREYARRFKRELTQNGRIIELNPLELLDIGLEQIGSYIVNSLGVLVGSADLLNFNVEINDYLLFSVLTNGRYIPLNQITERMKKNQELIPDTGEKSYYLANNSIKAAIMTQVSSQIKNGSIPFPD